MYKYTFFLLLLIANACNVTNETEHKEDIIVKGDTIIVSKESNTIKRITTKLISKQKYNIGISTFGIVQAIPTKYAEIASPFAGRITQSFIKLGQHVAKDAPLFAISSPAIYEAGKMYYQAKQEMELAEKNLKRQKDLYKNGVGVQKDLEEAEVSYELSKRDYENITASLKVYKVNPEKLVLGQPLIVRSPIAGDIVNNTIVIGQYLKEDAEPVVIVAELDKVWIVGQVKEKDISSINKDEDVEITASSLAEKKFTGKIYYISDLLDENTRSVKVFIESNNVNHMLKPGMYVSVKFIKKQSENILIPTSAAFQRENDNFVFVETDSCRFVKKSIKAQLISDDLLLVKNGLKEGDRIVTSGGYFLIGQK